MTVYISETSDVGNISLLVADTLSELHDAAKSLRVPLSAWRGPWHQISPCYEITFEQRRAAFDMGGHILGAWTMKDVAQVLRDELKEVDNPDVPPSRGLVNLFDMELKDA